MSQCVPNWELDDPPSSALPAIHPPSAAAVATNAAAAAAANTGSRSDYEVAELTWVNGHPSMHGLGQLRIGKPVPKYPSQGPWDKALASGGTLESVVDQATGAAAAVAAAAGLIPPSPSAGQSSPTAADYDLVPWITASRHQHHQHHNSRANGSSAVGGGPGSSFMDALVPCSNSRLVDEHATRVPEPHGTHHLGGARPAGKRGGAPCREGGGGGGGNCSVSGSAASMGGGVGMSFDACNGNATVAGDEVEFTTSTPPQDGSPETENTSYGRPVTAADENDSPSHSRPSLQRDACEGEDKRKGGEMVRSSVSTKRSRAAAVHNQSERKRRDRINQRMKTLQKLVPNSSKTDKASMLDEVIDYVKQLQAQVQMMNRMSTAATIPHMMMPAPMQMQQLQMAAMMAQMAQMAQMGMGMGMAMGMDMAPLAARQPAQAPAAAAAAAAAGLPPPAPVALHHPSAAAAFLPGFATAPAPWEAAAAAAAAAGDRIMGPPIMPTADPFSAFMACQAQKPPSTMDAFNRMAAAMYQQLYQQQQPQPQPQQPQQQNPGANLNK